MKYLLIVLSSIVLISVVYTQGGSCGQGVGSCTGGSCCSKWGYCGISDDHCLVSKGCQPNYGTCKDASGSKVGGDKTEKKKEKEKKKKKDKTKKEEKKTEEKKQEKKSSGNGLTEADATENERIVWKLLLKEGLTKAGAAGLMGNLMVESYVQSVVYEECYKPMLGMTDEEYVRKVNDGSYTNFVNDQVGFGLCQWTWYARKEKLLQKCRGKIGDMACQLDFLLDEIKAGYQGVLSFLKTSNDVSQCCIKFMKEFENPAYPNQDRRVALAQTYYEMFTGTGEKGHFYRIQKGDSLYDAAVKHGTTLQTIYDLNPGLNANIYVGQKIRIP